MCYEGAVTFFFVRKLGFSLAYLAVEMEASDILPLRPLDTDPDLWHLVALDADLIGPYHSYGDPNPGIPACPILGMPPLGVWLDVQSLQRGLRLCDYQAVKLDA